MHPKQPAGEDAVAPWRPASLAETHTAVVLFLGERAYKLKKPVDLGFLNFTTREARYRACHDEVELNRRFSPDVYLGVADVSDEEGRLCDHLVVMRRMPTHRRLSRCLTEGEDVSGALWQVAHLLAAAHAARPPDPAWDHVASVREVRRNWDDSFEVLRPYGGRILPAESNERLEHLVHRFLDGRGRLFDRRIAEGWVRDGHGDLQADDIFLLADGPRVLDCLEFDPRLRWADVLCDAAFLAMDLDRLGRPDLGHDFLSWHRELTGDWWPWALAHHYVAYRAHVRAKVSALRWTQGDADAADAAAGLLQLALQHMEEARVRLVLVGGLPGTGKSTLAAALGERLPVVVLRTDEVRDQLAPRTGEQPYGEGRYSPRQVAATYDELLAQARTLLEHGESVVLDASWSSAAARARAREVAAATSTDLVELRCEAPADVALGRLQQRRAAGRDPSEATPDVARQMAARFDPWPEARAVDTTQPREASVAAAMAAFAAVPS